MLQKETMKAHQKTIGKNDEWLTPPWVLNPLGVFDLDPCAPINRPWDTAMNHYTIKDDGFSLPWYGRVWLNPPFNRYERPKWMAMMSIHDNGIMLLPAAGETEAFQKYVWGRCAGILFLNRRPHFCDVTGTEAKANSGCTICLVAYGHKNFEILKNSSLGVSLAQV